MEKAIAVMWSHAKEYLWSPEAGKITDSSLKSLEGVWSCHHLNYVLLLFEVTRFMVLAYLRGSAGSLPGHSNKMSISVRGAVIFLVVEGIAFNL